MVCGTIMFLTFSFMVATTVVADAFRRTNIDFLAFFGGSHTRISVTPPNGETTNFPGLPSTNGPNYVTCLRNSWSAKNPLDSNCTTDSSATTSPPKVWMFAQGGSTISEVIKNPNESIGSFLTQTSKFNEAVMKKPVDGQKSMAFAEFATSDIRLAARDRSPQMTPEELVPKLVKSYFEQIDTLREAGVRNFAVSNVFNVTRFPEFKSMREDEKEYHRKFLPLYNTEFSTKLKEYQKAHTNCRMIFLDFFAATEEIFENPKKYGIEAPINEFCPYDYLGQGTSPIADCAENQQKAGCKPVQQYAFVNEAHFTTVVHREITKYIIQTIDKFSEEQVTKDPMIVPMNGCQRGKQKESADKHCSGANKSSDSNTGVSLVSASANGKISFTSTFTTDQTPIVTIKSKTKTDTGSRTTVQHDWGKQFKNMVGGIVCELTPKICAKK